MARKDLKKKRQEVDKLKMHRDEWWIEELKERGRLEAIEQDELGTVIHLKNKREGQSTR